MAQYWVDGNSKITSINKVETSPSKSNRSRSPILDAYQHGVRNRKSCDNFNESIVSTATSLNNQINKQSRNSMVDLKPVNNNIVKSNDSTPNIPAAGNSSDSLNKDHW